MAENMVKECITIRPVVSTKVNGLMIKSKIMELWSIQIKTFMRDIGSKDKGQVRELMHTQMVINTSAIGKMTQSTAMEFWKWLPVIDTKATGFKERKTDQVHFKLNLG